ncbi:hypothetical protein AOT83_04530 [Mycobacteroides sp. H001]|uniref:hypothetical protein n=1 Tax=unclassified Mycobacteroides TaxID=2618759 RepID=UPI0007138331|nr:MULTISPECIES: hypothetical protein [unclassified Mycobacteroides]KRQ31382.1 hypothetical protein AOT86_01870 [Mycobacteroides sp. H072]KRQ35858.1 hypothetical protein AOT84_15230 [Mycobacteroides sp. H002]KRQ50601.1 hypothetical protein AOT85_13990 [Mycobacteroides sp. H054]KRQ72637.1 hypothetical protein AOT83_04530 [Mycobacteroides sp. H001]
MKTLEINIDLMQKVHDKIMEEPRAHDQTLWATVVNDPNLIKKRRSGRLVVECPTAACVAGWACQIVGDIGVVNAHSLRFVDVGSPVEIDYVIPKGGRGEVFIGDRAGELLGLTHDQASVLFHEDNNRRMVLSMLSRTIAHKKAHPDQNVLIGPRGKHYVP